MDKTTREGVTAGLAAYLMWGFMAIFFKLLGSVEPMEILAHRVLWAVPFGALILLARRQWPEVKRAFTHRSMLGWLSVSTLFIAINWFIFIWAIQEERILEASLGYYINPLMNMLAGVWLFHERLRPFQLFAVALAAIGVVILTVSVGVIPWVALILALSFSIYSVVRKRVVIGGMPGLFVETTILLPFAVAWLLYLSATSGMAFAHGDPALSFWLLMAGPLTALPLLFFALAARRLALTTIGFMQFLAPTLQFATGVYYGETLTTAHLICFGFIWSAVAFFVLDALITAKKKPRQENPAGA